MRKIKLTEDFLILPEEKAVDKELSDLLHIIEMAEKYCETKELDIPLGGYPVSHTKTNDMIYYKKRKERFKF